MTRDKTVTHLWILLIPKSLLCNVKACASFSNPLEVFLQKSEKEKQYFSCSVQEGKKKHTHTKNHNRTGNYIQTISISIKAGTSPKGKNQNTCFMSEVIERLTATTWSPKQPCMSKDGKNDVSLTNAQDE